MSSSKIPHVVLKSSSNKINMPVIALGTAAMTNNNKETIKVAIIEAMKSGYRHFDTASFYGSEEALGEAIKEALQLGFIQSRDELFITSKLWVTDNFPHLVLPALQKSLQTLKLEYLDLYLVHWPISVQPGNWEVPYAEELITTFDLKGVWTSMEECYNLGLTKSIGVSNFSKKKLENLLSFAIIPPSVNQVERTLHVKNISATLNDRRNLQAGGSASFKESRTYAQVEMNPVWNQKKLKQYCDAKGIIITAYSPLGAKGTNWGSNEVMDSEILKDIAKDHGKTVAQVCLRWLYEQGVTMAVKSYNKERIKQNLEIFDWSLTRDDHEKIDQIKQIRTVKYGPAVFISNLWDEDEEP